MADSPFSPPPGGFIPSSLLSPPLSSAASVSTVTATLPHPRSTPLKPGGAKESALICFIDTGILKLERRYAKRGTEALDSAAPLSTRGYESFPEVAKDMENLFDLIWVSGTPGLQVPYLLSLASLLEQFLGSFPLAGREMFRLLERFDIAFASLLQGRHVETGETLPGLVMGRGVSGTEKVRMKSIVAATRKAVVKLVGSDGGGGNMDAEESRVVDVSDFETGDEMDVDDVDSTDEDEEGATRNLEMRVAKVYDRTVVELGDTIGASPIGIITDE